MRLDYWILRCILMFLSGTCLLYWLHLRRQKRLQDLQKGDRERLEEMVVKAMKRKGWKDAKRGKGRDDGGVDAFGHKDGEFRVVQVKRYSDKNYVGVETVRALVGAMKDRKADRSQIVTTGYLSKRAKEYCERNKVVVVDKRNIVDFLG